MEHLRRSIVALALAALLPAPALAWNAGTHVYVAKELNKEAGRADAADLAERLYGANSPDLFNYDFSEPAFTIADYLHEYTDDDAALRLWNAAEEGGDAALLAFAYGVASHDNAYGADSTAHWDAVTSGVEQGYVIAKAALLQPGLAQLLPGAPPETLALASHLLVELAVDALVAEELDPAIGEDLLASLEVDAPVGALLAAAYAEHLAPLFGGGPVGEAYAAATIAAYEQYHRTVILPMYGQALAAPDPFLGLAGWAQAAAATFLGVELSEAQAQTALAGAMQLCARDYRRELFATIGRVNGHLSSRGIAF